MLYCVQLLILPNIYPSKGPNLPLGKESLSRRLKEKSDGPNLGVLPDVGGHAHVLPHDASVPAPSPAPETGDPNPALQLARDVPVRRILGEGGDPSHRIGASVLKAALQAAGNDPDQETEADGPAPAPRIADVDQGHEVEEDGHHSGVVHLTDETDGRGNQATLQLSFSVSNAAQGLDHDAVLAKRLQGSLIWVKLLLFK